MGRIVLVTGVSRYLGSRIAQILGAEADVDRVIGVDVVPPIVAIPGIDFVRADIRNPVIAKVMADAKVDTVVHMGVIATPKQAGGRSTMKEINVIGTMQLLAACQRTPSLESLVVKSTSGVYGCGAKDPGMFTEDMEPKHAPTAGWPKDSSEVEGYVRGFGRRRPDVTVSTFRFANFMGSGIETAMTAYFSLPVIPTVLGFDARLQFIHVDDGLEILRRAVHDRRVGTFNVAGPGVLTLSQAIRMTGRPRVALPEFLLTPVGRSLSRAGLLDFSYEQVRFITYGRVLDTSLVARAFDFIPAYSTHAAFDEFLARGEEMIDVA